MKLQSSRFLRIAGTLATAALCALAGVAAADETEIFVGTGNAVSNQRPNILFIMDTSGSMSEEVETQVPFNPADDYPGSCADDVIYYERGSNSSDPPGCTDGNSVPVANFKCDAASQVMDTAGYYIADRAAQWRGNPRRWRSINGSNAVDAWVECRPDAGVHGNGIDTTELWAADGSNGPWSSLSGQQIGWNANGADRGYVFYNGNYINWLRNGSTITQTRLEIIKIVATQTINQLAASDQVNVGLMQFSNNLNLGCNTLTSEGGMVLQPIAPVGTNSAAMLADIAALNADGCTPLSETLYEAYLYLSGGQVDYGINSRKDPSTPYPSIASSREPAPNTDTYESPLTESCEKNFIVYLTDGLPTADDSANTEIGGLIGGPCIGTGQGRCLDDLSQYMYENDLRPSLPGMQNVTTYTIGFGPDVNNSPLLQNTASGGGGVFYEASDTASLSTV
ncbi:MAG: vWA domain-containing protein, partial [Planctomycetaceae bacterium]